MMLPRLLSIPAKKRVWQMLPARRMDAPPRATVNSLPAWENGRSLRDGADRAWTLEFGSAMYDIWRDPLYRIANRRAAGKSVIEARRQLNLYLLIRFYLASSPQRNIIELGTWKGGNLLFMATLLREIDPTAKVYGLDTFAGMPETDAAADLHRAGDFSDISMEAIRAAAEHYQLNNIELVKGDIRDTLPRICREVPFGLAHIDLDIYDPIKFAQTELFQCMPPGGYIVYDDALVSSCPGATMAVEETICTGRSCEQIFPHVVFRT